MIIELTIANFNIRDYPQQQIKIYTEPHNNTYTHARCKKKKEWKLQSTINIKTIMKRRQVNSQSASTHKIDNAIN